MCRARGSSSLCCHSQHWNAGHQTREAWEPTSPLTHSTVNMRQNEAALHLQTNKPISLHNLLSEVIQTSHRQRALHPTMPCTTLPSVWCRKCSQWWSTDRPLYVTRVTFCLTHPLGCEWSKLGLPTIPEWPGSSRNWPTVSRVPGEADFVPEMWKLTTGHGYMAVNKCHDKLQQSCQKKQFCYTCLTNLCIKLQNVISMISFSGTSSPD